MTGFIEIETSLPVDRVKNHDSKSQIFANKLITTNLKLHIPKELQSNDQITDYLLDELQVLSDKGFQLEIKISDDLKVGICDDGNNTIGRLDQSQIKEKNRRRKFHIVR